WTHHFVVLEQAMTGKPLDMEVWQRGVDLSERFGFHDVRWFLHASIAVHAAISGDVKEMTGIYDTLTDLLRRMGNPQMAESRLPMWVAPFWTQRLEREQA